MVLDIHIGHAVDGLSQLVMCSGSPAGYLSGYTFGSGSDVARTCTERDRHRPLNH